jgi:hypothetical protein
MSEIVERRNQRTLMQSIHAQAEGSPAPFNSFMPLVSLSPGEMIEDEILYAQQLRLSAILETAASCEEALGLLRQSSLSHSDWNIEDWDPALVETAMKIAQKWKR